MSDVNAFELFLLGRKLMKLGEQAIPSSGQQSAMATSVRLVMADIAYHPGSSVSDITERTGFPQSHVSQSIARLREFGAVVTEPDPADRRRTLVRPVEGALRRGARQAAMPTDQAIAEAIGPEARDQLPEALAALDLLGQLIVPEIHRSAESGDRQPATT
jgi:DNA-binding MarR family transcriptional regulator